MSYKKTRIRIVLNCLKETVRYLFNVAQSRMKLGTNDMMSIRKARNSRYYLVNLF